MVLSASFYYLTFHAASFDTDIGIFDTGLIFGLLAPAIWEVASFIDTRTKDTRSKVS